MCISTRARSSGPIPVEAELEWRGGGLLEGQLVISLADGQEVRSTYVFPDVALAGGSGTQTFRLLLPSPGSGGYNSQLAARMRLVSERGVFRLGEYPVFVPTRNERGLVVCMSEPRGSPGPRALALFSSLRLERFDPKRRSTGGSDGSLPGRPISTTPSYRPPEDMPGQPGGCCASDVIVLVNEGLSLLRARQLDAMLAWARAGGSVLVIPGGGLKAHHAEFLNALAGAPREASEYRLTPGGTVEGDAGLRRYHVGIGRAVVGLEADGTPLLTDEALEGPRWREAAGFLWKVREAQRETVIAKGAWRGDQEAAEENVDWRHQQWRDDRLRYGRVPIRSGGALLGALMPESIKVLPLWLIVVMLVLFVVVIGPVDYLVLGLLKRRKLTWITFPAAAVGFALFTMVLSEIYMGRQDHRNALTIMDLGEGGSVLRTSRYEVIFAARNRTSKTEVAGGFFTPVDVSTVRLSRDPRRYSKTDGTPPLYEGRVPSRYAAVQEINQWDPRMNRLFFFGMEPPGLGEHGTSTPPLAKLDWDGLDRGLLEMPEQAARARVLAVLGDDSRHEVSVRAFCGKRVHSFGKGRAGITPKLLRELCVRPQVGLFSVVSQVSPTGGGDFEDVALLDPTDPEQWMLVVVVRDGQNFTVYRRLYHDGANAR